MTTTPIVNLLVPNMYWTDWKISIIVVMIVIVIALAGWRWYALRDKARRRRLLQADGYLGYLHVRMRRRDVPGGQKRSGAGAATTAAAAAAGSPGAASSRPARHDESGDHARLLDDDDDEAHARPEDQHLLPDGTQEDFY